jgi:hypothetical protein
MMAGWLSRFASQSLADENDVLQHQFQVLAVQEQNRVEDGIPLAQRETLGVCGKAIGGKPVAISVQPPPVAAIVHVDVAQRVRAAFK